MRLDLDTGEANANQIRSYDGEKIQVNDQIFTHSIIITPTLLIDTWEPQSVAALTTSNLRELVALKPDVIIIGTGNKLIFPAQELLGPIIAQKIGVEVMNTAAACRTYNVLMSEYRNVVAGLMIK